MKIPAKSLALSTLVSRSWRFSVIGLFPKSSGCPVTTRVVTFLIYMGEVVAVLHNAVL
jgi:hypothetical protein